MKFIFVCAVLFIIACDNDLEQIPPNLIESSTLTDFQNVLNAAYYYQHSSATPLAVMGDFRADNAKMEEEPFPEFDKFGPGLTAMEDQFFGPFYTAMYRSILSSNNVIENSSNRVEVGEAQFLRALSYFKLVQVFGDVPVNLSAQPSVTDPSIFKRQPVADVYSTIIIPDLKAARDSLDNGGLAEGRATQIAAQALLGKVYIYRESWADAVTELAAVINGAASAGVALQTNFTDVFGDANDLNSEILFATQISSEIVDEYGFSEFTDWYIGGDTKANRPLDADLVAAFDAVASDTLNGGDVRRSFTIDDVNEIGIKYPQNADQDWIEIRLADVILLYAEALNESGSASAEEILDLLDPIRKRANLDALDHTSINTKELVRQAIADERRLELAFEGHRWFDLVRTGTVDAEMGETVNANYYLFPIPISEILATKGVITQNPGY